MQNLTPNQALEYIYQAASLAPLPSKEHEAVVNCVKYLMKFIKEAEAEALSKTPADVPAPEAPKAEETTEIPA